MKRIISILGSTGSIGSSTLNIINKDIKKFSFNVFSANSNYNKIIFQIMKYKPKYFIVSDKKTYLKINKKLKKSKTLILDNYKNIFSKNFKNDITVAAIPGLAGLEPTIQFTKNSKKILIANK